MNLRMTFFIDIISEYVLLNINQPKIAPIIAVAVMANSRSTFALVKLVVDISKELKRFSLMSAP